jgi:hypothetical protein
LAATGAAALPPPEPTFRPHTRNSYVKFSPQAFELCRRARFAGNSRRHGIRGTLSKSQAASLHHEDHQVRQEERDMAGQNGGHITKSEKRALNGQENHLSGQIPPK